MGNRSEIRDTGCWGQTELLMLALQILYPPRHCSPLYSFPTVQISMSVTPCALPTHHARILLGATSALAILALHQAVDKRLSQIPKWHVKVSRGLPRWPRMCPSPHFMNFFIYLLFIADIDECIQDPSPCGQNSACTNVPGSYICSCLPNFRPDPEGSQAYSNFSCKSNVLVHQQV